MVVPRQMTAHTLETIKNSITNLYHVDFVAKFNATQLAAISGNVAFSGRVVHLNASGEFEFGAADHQMPLFLWGNSDDPDVENPGGDPATVAGAWVAVAPVGWMKALVAIGGFELASTEFNSALSYAPNDLLKAATGTTLATAGVLTNASVVLNTDNVVGVVSRGKRQNSHGVWELCFWPVYCPA